MKTEKNCLYMSCSLIYIYLWTNRYPKLHILKPKTFMTKTLNVDTHKPNKPNWHINMNCHNTNKKTIVSYEEINKGLKISHLMGKGK